MMRRTSRQAIRGPHARGSQRRSAAGVDEGSPRGVLGEQPAMRIVSSMMRLIGKAVDAQPNGASATNYCRRGPVPPQHASDGQVTLFVESEL